MAITAGVGSATASTATVTSQAVTLNSCTAGRQLLIGVAWDNATATISSITVSGESDATVHASPQRSTHATPTSLQLASLANITASGNKIVTVNMSASVTISVTVVEVQGGDTAAFYTGNEASTTADEQDDGTITWSITTVNANDSIFGLIFSGASTITGPTGYDDISANDTFNTVVCRRLLDAGAAQTFNPSATVNAFGKWAAKFGVFKAAGSPQSQSPRTNFFRMMQGA